jgi:hypothetical protein
MSTRFELTRCPDETCGTLAEVSRRWTVGSTSGALSMAQTRCLDRHMFVLPATRLHPATLGPHRPPSADL